MGSCLKASVKTKWICWPPRTKINFLVFSSLALLSKSHFSFVTELCCSNSLFFTCELFLAAVSHTRLQVLQLDLDLLVVPQGLLTLSPNREEQGERTSNVSCTLD